MKTDVVAITDAVTKRVAARAVQDRWVACSVIWTRLWAEGESAWKRWPDEAVKVFDGLCIALSRVGGLPDPSSAEVSLTRLEVLELEDDGSADWQLVVDLAAMLISALGDDDVDTCVETAIQTYLEGTFNVVSNELAAKAGLSISHRDALKAMEASPAWQHALSVVTAL